MSATTFYRSELYLHWAARVMGAKKGLTREKTIATRNSPRSLRFRSCIVPEATRLETAKPQSLH